MNDVINGARLVRRRSAYGLLALVMLLLTACAAHPSKPSRFTQQQVRALQTAGFTEDSLGDWSFGLSDRLLFASDISQLLPAREQQLRRLAHTLIQAGIRHVRVDGYADSSGSESYNLELSKRRARSVVEALVKAGMPADAIAWRGLGAANPIADNRRAQGRAENRRAVLVISAP